jgi:hypothetical protein
VTTPARTVVDCLRHGGAEVGVPMGDAALNLGFTDEATLDDVLAFQSGWPYAGRALAGRPWLGRRESWLESRSFLAFARSGMPLPQSQIEVFDAHGLFVARVDFGWLEDGVVGEADGLGKYDLSSYGAAQPDAVAAAGPRLVDVEEVRRRLQAQAVRQQQLEDLRLRVVRWGTSDVAGSARPLVARIEQARRLWSGRHFTGTFRLASPNPTVTPRVHAEMPHIPHRNPHSRGKAVNEG